MRRKRSGEATGGSLLSAPAESDEELMARFYACDGAALEEIARRCRERLVPVFLRGGWSQDEAETFVQELLLHILQTKESGTGRYDPARGPFGPWAR